MYRQYILFSGIICLITCSNLNQHVVESTKDGSAITTGDDTDTIAFDPTFGQLTLEPTQTGLPLLDSRKSKIKFY